MIETKHPNRFSLWRAMGTDLGTNVWNSENIVVKKLCSEECEKQEFRVEWSMVDANQSLRNSNNSW